jgi:surface-anchored protein
VRTTLRFAAASAAAAVALPATAEEISPSSAGIAVLDEGHVDVIGVAYEDGELELHVHDEENDAEYEPGEVLLVVNPGAKTTVPNDPAYSFLGSPGAKVWILPDTEVDGLLFAGWATEEVDEGVFVDDELTITVHQAKGLGKVALYVRDDFGSPEVLFDSKAGAGSWDVPADSHGHLNWAFTKPGLYKVTVEASGVIEDGDEEVSSGLVDYWFWVRK